jgi:hypothetical protein
VTLGVAKSVIFFKKVFSVKFNNCFREVLEIKKIMTDVYGLLSWIAYYFIWRGPQEV